MSAQPLPSEGAYGAGSETAVRSMTGDIPGVFSATSPDIDRLLTLSTELARLASGWGEGTGSKEAIRALEQISRSVSAIQASVLTALKSDGGWAADGERTFDSWVTTQTGRTRRSAGQAVRLSESLNSDLPETKGALARGEISSEHAQILARQCARTEKQRDRLADPARGEGYLLEQAKEMDAGRFAKVARSWAIENDPKAADRQWRKESAKEELVLTPAEDGVHISGFLNPVRGAILKEALAAHMGRKAKDDDRSFTERQADGLVSLASQSLDAGFQMPNARIRPHLSVTLEYDTLDRLTQAAGSAIPPELLGEGPGQFASEARWAEQWKPGDDHDINASLDFDLMNAAIPAELPDGTPLPHRVLSRVACESMLTRIIFGPDSAVLNVGREQRIFTAHQTRAIIARDRTCRYPGCSEGPGFGEIHHSISWAKHKGDTDVELGILLCYHHHDLVHERDITIQRRGGLWIFIDRFGRPIDPDLHSVSLLDTGESLASFTGNAQGSGSNVNLSASAGKSASWSQVGDNWDVEEFDDATTLFDSQGPPPF